MDYLHSFWIEFDIKCEDLNIYKFYQKLLWYYEISGNENK
jgi:hypothetical protein